MKSPVGFSLTRWVALMQPVDCLRDSDLSPLAEAAAASFRTEQERMSRIA